LTKKFKNGTVVLKVETMEHKLYNQKQFNRSGKPACVHCFTFTAPVILLRRGRMDNTIPKNAVERCSITRKGKIEHTYCTCGCSWFKVKTTWKEGTSRIYTYTCIECGKKEIE